jgi:hypothetical protein
MAIDDCRYTFLELAVDILPKHMDRMRTALKNPWPMQMFAIKGEGKTTVLRRLERDSDFPGCYVLLDRDREEPVYVGISRTIVQRLLQHVKGTTHYDASLAYKMASEENSRFKSRKEAMANCDFRALFENKKAYLASLDTAFIEISNDLELHLFEAYCAMELDTCEWNTFQTH